MKPIEVSDTRNQKDGTGGNNLPLVCFSKVSHPTAPNGEGERWDEREVAQTRNTFDNGEKRCQEVVVSANGVSFDGRKDAPIADGVAHSQTIGTNPGFKDGVVIGLDGYNKTLTGDCAPTISGAACDLHHTHGVISTNSNGGDVAATINANMSKLGGDNQTTFGGGYRITRREEGAHDEPQL